jgi:hypothetical protein
MATERTIEGPTPNGGVRSTAYFLDEHNKPVEQAQATRVEIVEFDASGQEIHRTYGIKEPG